MNLWNMTRAIDVLRPHPTRLAEPLMWASLAFVLVTYVGYPTMLKLLSRLAPRPRATGAGAPPDEELPSVTCIVATHNGGRQLLAKVRNLLEQDYPAGRLHVLIADDGSTDDAPRCARSLAPGRVRVVSNPKRLGKSSALVLAVRASQSPFLVMCDTRQQFEAGAVRALVRRFAAPEVGVVTGRLKLDGARGPGAYWRYETAIRQWEASIGSVVGVTGAIYAIRRECFPLELPPRTVLDDLYVPMRAVLDGWRVEYAVDAVAYDVELKVGQEFERKVRTLAGNYQLLTLLPALLLPWRNPLFWQFLWHKLARLGCPWALGLALVSSLVAPGAVPKLMACHLLGVGTLASWGAWSNRPPRLATLCHSFVALNLAALVGLWRFLRGGASGIWHITREAPATVASQLRERPLPPGRSLLSAPPLRAGRR